MTTVDEYQYDQYWYTTFGQDHTLFKVQACSDPHIILATAVGDFDNVYEVALGEDLLQLEIICENPYIHCNILAWIWYWGNYLISFCLSQ